MAEPKSELAQCIKSVKELQKTTEELGRRIARNKRNFRVFLLWFVLAVYAAINLHDQHVVSCYPPKDRATERICNITFPFHNHPQGHKLGEKP